MGDRPPSFFFLQASHHRCHSQQNEMVSLPCFLSLFWNLLTLLLVSAIILVLAVHWYFNLVHLNSSSAIVLDKPLK
jgi:hypothetical protein